VETVETRVIGFDLPFPFFPGPFEIKHSRWPVYIVSPNRLNWLHTETKQKQKAKHQIN